MKIALKNAKYMLQDFYLHKDKSLGRFSVPRSEEVSKPPINKDLAQFVTVPLSLMDDVVIP